MIITKLELSALLGLPHTQQSLYFMGIRPYMDYSTGIVGIKRGISYQALREALFVEPHPGIKGGSPSRQQLRRAVRGLERAKLLKIQSEGKRLIVKCLLAKHDNAQNKADTKSTQQAGIGDFRKSSNKLETYHKSSENDDISKTVKAATPPVSGNNNIFLTQRFEKFWQAYPEKKSRAKAEAIFCDINPDDALFDAIMQGLQRQIAFYQRCKAQGAWAPNWKHPENWLQAQSWEDEITAKNRRSEQCTTSKKNSKTQSNRNLIRRMLHKTRHHRRQRLR